MFSVPGKGMGSQQVLHRHLLTAWTKACVSKQMTAGWLSGLTAHYPPPPRSYFKNTFLLKISPCVTLCSSEGEPTVCGNWALKGLSPRQTHSCTARVYQGVEPSRRPSSMLIHACVFLGMGLRDLLKVWTQLRPWRWLPEPSVIT